MINLFIISQHAMFGHGLASLLQAQTEFNILGQETNLEKAIDRVDQLQPDVIILDSEEPKRPPTQEALEILHHLPSVKIVGLNLESNDLIIYQSCRYTVKNETDLIVVIEQLMNHNVIQELLSFNHLLKEVQTDGRLDKE